MRVRTHLDAASESLHFRTALAKTCTDLLRPGFRVRFDRKHDVPGRDFVLEIAARYLQQGRNAFVVGNRLAELFHETSMKDMRPSELRAPFPVFYIALPDWNERYRSPKGEALPVRGIYAWQIDPATLWLVVWCEAGSRSVTFTLTLHLPQHIEGEKYRPEARFATELAEQPVLVERIGELVLSLLLYLSSRGPELAPETVHREARPERRRRERAGEPPHPCTAVESQCWVARSAEAAPSETSSGVGGPTRRHWVRGHWHGYWVGTDAQRRIEIRWIRPFERGTDLAGIVSSRVYRLDENDVAGEPSAPKA